MNDALNREAQILAQAAEQDMNRQRQIEQQKQSINRLLEANTKLQEKIDAAINIANEAGAEGNNSEYVDRMATILAEPIDG